MEIGNTNKISDLLAIRIVLRRQYTNVENMHYVISDCFILHNVCINYVLGIFDRT